MWSDSAHTGIFLQSKRAHTLHHSWVGAQVLPSHFIFPTNFTRDIVVVDTIIIPGAGHTAAGPCARAFLMGSYPSYFPCPLQPAPLLTCMCPMQGTLQRSLPSPCLTAASKWFHSSWQRGWQWPMASMWSLSQSGSSSSAPWMSFQVSLACHAVVLCVLDVVPDKSCPS